MLGISVWTAIFNAIARSNPGQIPRLDTPATPEAILRAVKGDAGMKMLGAHLRRAGAASAAAPWSPSVATPKARRRAKPVPRMVVTPEGYHGTIGGGALEWQAIATAQAMLSARCRIAPHQPCARSRSRPMLRRPVSNLATEVFDRSRLAGDIRRRMTEASASAPPRSIFSARAMSGRALVLALAPLPFDVIWIDPRADGLSCGDARQCHAARAGRSYPPSWPKRRAAASPSSCRIATRSTLPSPMRRCATPLSPTSASSAAPPSGRASRSVCARQALPKTASTA